MASESIAGRKFSEFVERHGRGLQHALVAALGPDVGAEATSEALVYGWEHWGRVSSMDNPVGFLFTVGRNWGRRQFRRSSALRFPTPVAVHQSDPQVEPALPAALAGLSERQRVATLLVHGAGWTLAEVADLLGVDRGTVRQHAERGLSKLRVALEVNVDA
jgi:RNA polymerase sigma factor (sigma-70 family)